MGAALVLIATGGTLLLLHPALGLYALAFAIPFGSLRQLSVGGVSVGATDALVAGVGVAWLARMLVHGKLRLPRAPLTLPLSLYLAALAISLLPAPQIAPAAKEVAKWTQVLLVYLLVAGELGRRERVAALLAAALLAAGLAQGLLGIYQFMRQVGPPAFVLFGRYMRAHGTFLQPNPYGGYLGLLLPLAYSLVLALWPGTSSAAGQRRTGWVALWALAGLASGIMGAALLMSWSRGALLGLFAGLGLVATARLRRAWPVLASAILILALVAPAVPGLLPQGFVSRLTDSFVYVGMDLTAVEITDDNFAVIERMAHWAAAWRMFESSPWLGVGTGQYAVAYEAVAIPRWDDPLGHAHNYYLNTLAETGLLGLGAYLVLMLAALVTVWRAARHARGLGLGLALGALGMWGHLTAHSAFDNLYVHGMYLLVAMLLGMATGLPQGPTRREDGPVLSPKARGPSV
jgi:O-antigen ligase